jgi:opacity protein-like surface antigen
MRIRTFISACAVALALVPSVASADGYFVPFVGANFGGEVGRPLSAAVQDRNIVTFGAGFGTMGAGVFGVELDLGYTSKFYTDTSSAVTRNNLLTVMPALILGVPIGGQKGIGVRPYVVAGAGLIRRDVEFNNLTSLSANDLGYTLGGGVMGFMSNHVGIRGDVRYFRNFQVDEFSLAGVNFEQGTFNFGRASVGVILRF